MGIGRIILAFSLLLPGLGLAAQPEREQLLNSIANLELSEAGRVMKFDATVLEVGEVAEDADPPEYVFTWTNEGDAPVTVLKVSSSCSCMVASFEKTPVAPGEKSSLKITYHPKGRLGAFNRRILVYTDQSLPKPAVALYLKGKVTPAEVQLPVWRFGYQMGSLYLKQKDLHLKGDARAVERIVCLNAGDTPLTIGIEAALLPPYISFSCEPETIPAGGEGELVITYDPSASGMRMLNVVPLVLTGLDLPPSQRTIRVIFDNDRKIDIQ